MLHSRGFGVAFLIAFFLGFTGAVQATSFTLGNVSGPTTLTIGNNKGPGSFTDRYYFSIDPGVALDVSAFATTGFSRISFIPDLDGTLSGASGVIVDGDALTIFAPEGFPKRDVSFATTLLGPGNYVLSLFGTATAAFPGPASPYSGSIQFATTPLPAALFFMLTALAALGLMGRHRKAPTSAGAWRNGDSGQIQFAATPLPGALLLMLTALGGMGICGRFRSRLSA